MPHTTYQLKRAAVRLFPAADFPQIPKQSRRHNQSAWMRAVAILGPHWIVNKPIPKKDAPND